MLSFKVFLEMKKDFNIICKEIERWIKEPHKLFRFYTVHYMKLLFNKEIN
jgi:hypothetical protein